MNLYFLIAWAFLLTVVSANTEVVSIHVPEYIETRSSDQQDFKGIVKLSTDDDLNRYSISTRWKRQFSVDYLKLTKRSFAALGDSRSLSPVILQFEIKDLEIGGDYNFKLCWSALNPIDVEMKGIELDDKMYLEVTLKANYYTANAMNIQRYMNDIVVEIECIDRKLIVSIIRWILICVIVGISVSSYLVKDINKKFTSKSKTD